jgi:DNA polymerase-3 subunit epsilon
MSWFTRLRDTGSTISVAIDFGAILRSRAGVEAARAGNVNPFSVPLAVVDVETTGTWAEGTDRIAEIAILHLNQNLETIAEYSSLVNPRRDLGATWLHGITGQDIASAPLFSDVVDDVAHWLRGHAIVAYNGRLSRVS